MHEPSKTELPGASGRRAAVLLLFACACDASTSNPNSGSLAFADAGRESTSSMDAGHSTLAVPDGASSESNVEPPDAALHGADAAAATTDTPLDGGDAAGHPTANSVMERAQELLALGHFPGIALATFDASGVTWSTGLGHANAAGDRTVTADTSFWLASVTKPITGLALLRAQEQGVLSLDSKIAEVLREHDGFELASTRAEEITLRDLVTHRSPIRDGENYQCAYFLGTESQHSSLANLILPEPLCNDELPVDLGGFLQSYLSADGGYYSPDNFADEETGSVYSNVGAALAGYAVGLATGTPLKDFARDNLFEPLGLAHTSFYLADLDANDIAVPTYWDAENEVPVEYPFYELATWPDGALRSSANDLGRLYATLLAGGELDGNRILDAESVQIAFTPIQPFEDGYLGVFWALSQSDALSVDGQVRTFASHSGGDPGAFTYVVIDLEHRFGTVLLANGELTELPAGQAFEALAREQFLFAETLVRSE